MKPVVLAAALAATLLVVACDRAPQPRTDTPPAASGAGPSTPAQSAPQTSSTGTPTLNDRKEGGNPVQGEVDPKSGAQHRDFQQKGDAAGPQSAETTPKSN